MLFLLVCWVEIAIFSFAINALCSLIRGMFGMAWQAVWSADRSCFRNGHRGVWHKISALRH